MNKIGRAAGALAITFGGLAIGDIAVYGIGAMSGEDVKADIQAEKNVPKFVALESLIGISAAGAAAYQYGRRTGKTDALKPPQA